MIKEIIRRIYFWLCEIGLASPEIEAKTGTLRYRFLNWLYGDGVPTVNAIWPDGEQK